FVTGRGVAVPFGSADGSADPATIRRLTPETPLRTASNTKMIVAATVLRLWEQERIALDAPIDRLIDRALRNILRAAGYRPDRMTIRQLLSHSAGLRDHAEHPDFLATALADRRHVWTRATQVGLLRHYPRPLAEPGQAFHYSDTGYVLLGDIVERLTGERLAAVVRRELSFEKLGLTSTWWETMEEPPAGVEPRARQYLGDTDTTELNGTMDAFGGGGLIMSVRDLAQLTAALFEGRIFERAATLEEMTKQGTHLGAADYRFGLMAMRVGGHQCYAHLGYWGTAAYYAPGFDIAVAGFTANRSARPALISIVEQILQASVRQA
ncbi:serine hydrolase domain-containing protein, partial [Rhizobiaceae sp. 2RAB30]